MGFHRAKMEIFSMLSGSVSWKLWRGWICSISSFPSDSQFPSEDFSLFISFYGKETNPMVLESHSSPSKLQKFGVSKILDQIHTGGANPSNPLADHLDRDPMANHFRPCGDMFILPLKIHKQFVSERPTVFFVRASKEVGYLKKIIQYHSSWPDVHISG